MQAVLYPLFSERRPQIVAIEIPTPTHTYILRRRILVTNRKETFFFSFAIILLVFSRNANKVGGFKTEFSGNRLFCANCHFTDKISTYTVVSMLDYNVHYDGVPLNLFPLRGVTRGVSFSPFTTSPFFNLADTEIFFIVYLHIYMNSCTRD